MYNSFYMLLHSASQYFVDDFCIHIPRTYCFVGFFPRDVFGQFLYQGNADIYSLSQAFKKETAEAIQVIQSNTHVKRVQQVGCRFQEDTAQRELCLQETSSMFGSRDRKCLYFPSLVCAYCQRQGREERVRPTRPAGL